MADGSRLSNNDLVAYSVRLIRQMESMKFQVAQAEAHAEREADERRRAQRQVDLLRQILVSHLPKFGFDSEEKTLINDALEYDGRDYYRMPDLREDESEGEL